MKLLDYTKGWKTYATVVLGLGVGVYAAVTGHDIPVWGYAILGFAGLGFHRSALSNQAQIATTDVLSLVQAVLAQVSTPDTLPSTNLPVRLVGAVEPIVVGQPTPTSIPEEEVTKSLNKAQV